MLTYNFKNLLEIPLVCHLICIGIYKLIEQVGLFKMADLSLICMQKTPMYIARCCQALAYVDL